MAWFPALAALLLPTDEWTRSGNGRVQMPARPSNRRAATDEWTRSGNGRVQMPARPSNRRAATDEWTRSGNESVEWQNKNQAFTNF